jgi:drug/metabolite transporter (DMT)-like permease
MMQSLRIIIASLVVITVLLFRRNFRQLSKVEWFYTVLAGLTGVVGHHFFLAVGLVHTTASNAALILALIPLTTSILAILFLRDRLTRLRLVGIVLGFTGVAFVILQGNGGVGKASIGDLYVLCSMVIQASSFILIKKISDTVDTKQMTAIMFIMGSTILLIISFLFEPQGIAKMSMGTLGAWMTLLASAVLATGVGHMLYNSAIHQIGAGQTAIFNNLVPFFSLLAAAAFLGESITLAQIIGFVLIVVGVVLGTGYLDERLKRLPTEEALRVKEVKSIKKTFKGSEKDEGIER